MPSSQTPITLSQPIMLPCGAVLSNRIAKAAMSEGLSDSRNHATPRLERLYARWAESGAGLLLSGNIQVDRDHLERPVNVVADDDGGAEALRRMARAGTSRGAHFWAQLGHTGRQVDAAVNAAPLAPSVVEIEVLRGAGLTFAPPRAMSEAEIARAIGQFASAAARVRAAGFTGIELHAAHGYLISQFLSPRTNLRRDAWGGSLENRARFLIETIAAVRNAVGPAFPVGIKLNASDFLKGGFTNAECIALVRMLNGTSLDLIELSGGSLEQPKVIGATLLEQGEDGRRESTRRREAYFIDFAGAVRRVAKMPVMVTGGFRTVAAMEEALAHGDLDIVGIGRPMIVDPRAPARILAGEVARLAEPVVELLHIIPWYSLQMERMGDGLDPDPSLSGEVAAAQFTAIETANFVALREIRGKAAA